MNLCPYAEEFPRFWDAGSVNKGLECKHRGRSGGEIRASKKCCASVFPSAKALSDSISRWLLRIFNCCQKNKNSRPRETSNDWEGNDRKITAKKSNLFPKIWPLNNYGEFWSFWPSANAWIHSLVSNQIPCQAPKFRFSV